MKRITRRKFLGTMAAGVTAMPLLAQASEGESARILISKKTPAEGVPDLLASIPEATNLLVKGARVVLKPNISWPNPPAWATTTSPEVTTAVARYCLDQGAVSILVIDHPLHHAERCRKLTQVAQQLEDIPRARVFLLEKPRHFVPRQLPAGCQRPQVGIAKELLRATCLINLPVAKAHSTTSVSFGIKNLMGLIEDRSILHTEADLHKAIAELLHVVTPQITILDATRILTSNGPQGPGKVEQPGILAAGTDPVAVDAYACSLARWDGRALRAQDIGHIAHAAQLGFGSTEFTLVEV